MTNGHILASMIIYRFCTDIVAICTICMFENTHNLEQRKTKPKYTHTFSIMLWCASFGWKENKKWWWAGYLKKETSNKPSIFKEGLYCPDVLAAVICATRRMISNDTWIVWEKFSKNYIFFKLISTWVLTLGGFWSCFWWFFFPSNYC